MNNITSFRKDYFFLSNFYPCKIEYNNRVFKSVEHAFQAAKCDNENEQRIFLYLSTPKEARSWGRKITMRADWDKIKLTIMKNLLWQKFSNNENLKELLLKTKDAELIEGNTWNDTFWGVCNGIGNNWLGKILMEIRENIDKGDLVK